ANTSVAASMSEHSRLIEALQSYLVLVSDSSGLTMDPESHGYFLQEMITRRIPETANSLRLLRAAAVQAARNKQMTPEERVRLQMQVEEAEADYAALQSGMSKALRDNPALQARLAPAINQLRDRQVLFL